MQVREEILDGLIFGGLVAALAPLFVAKSGPLVAAEFGISKAGAVQIGSSVRQDVVGTMAARSSGVSAWRA